MQRVQGKGAGCASFGAVCLRRAERKLHRRRAQPAGSVRLWHRPEELGTKSPRRGKFRQRNCPSLPMELRIHRLGLAKKIADQTQRNDLAHQQVLAAIFGQMRLDKHPGMTDDGILTFCATPRAKQFQNGTKSLKELEGDKAKQNVSLQTRDRRRQDFFETNRARVAHVVHAQSLEGTHGVKLYVTTMTTSNACSFAKQFFLNLATAKSSRCASLQMWEVFCEPIRARLLLGGTGSSRTAFFLCSDPECAASSQ